MRTEAALPTAVMKAVRAITNDDDLHAAEKFEATVLLVHGFGLYAAADSVDPTSFAIPRPQWTAINQMLIHAARSGGPFAPVNMSIDWMNIGPSAYEAVNHDG